ncbi:MAG: hypothetical protein Q8R34_00145 [bacterium]|nr:hypothetical protein [bacterium]
MFFLVTIVLQSFSNSQRIVASRIDSSHNFSIIIETSTKKIELLAEFNEKLNYFIEAKEKTLQADVGTGGVNVVLSSVSTVKL